MGSDARPRGDPLREPRLSAALAAGLMLVLLCLVSLAPVAEPPSIIPAGDTALPWPQLPSPSYAVQAFLWWRPEIARRDIQLVREMGFDWIKQSFAWRDIEDIQKGHYNWYFPDLIVDEVEKAGLKLLVRLDRQPFWSQGEGADLYLNGPPLDPADFGDFCYTLAGRYRGRIHAYQVWNEPNLSREWGDRTPDATEYVALLRNCYTSIKSADPEAIVISAGLAPTGVDSPLVVPDERFLREMYLAGAAPFFDMLGVNAPGYKAPPETSPQEAADPDNGWGGHRTFAFRHVEEIRSIMVANGDAAKQIAILEMGWSTDPRPDSPYHWHSVTEEEQAEYLVRAYRYADEHWPWVGLMTSVYIAKYDWTEVDEEYWWAITYPVFPETRVRPAYNALRAMAIETAP